jgi:glycosyltransferase involved in cell wall biosynthesis
LQRFEIVPIDWLDRGPLRFFERAVRRVQYELKLPYAAFFESIRFAQACRQQLADCDLLYERMGWVGYGGGLAARWLRVPLILEVNGDHLSEMEMLGVAPRGMQRRLSLVLMRQAAHRASHVVATGHGWRERFIERWGVAPERVTVIENGTEMVNLLDRDQLHSFRSLEDLPDLATVIYIGAFEPWHGVTILVRAFAKAIAHGARVRLILVGSGSQQATVQQLVQELGVEECTTLTGYLAPQQIAPYLAQADIGVSPYCGRVEYSGLKLLDYKAAGLVTLASGESGQPSIIEHGRTGWVVPPCDEEALCEAMVQLADDTSLRQKIGRTARLEAEECHTWRHTAQQLEQLFVRSTAFDHGLDQD